MEWLRKLPRLSGLTGLTSARKARPPLVTAPRQRLPFDFQMGEALGALGMRNTGKTFLVKRLYRDLMSAYPEACGYVIDSNAAGDFTGWRGAYAGLECPVIHASARGRQVVWQPPYDDYQAYEDFFKRLFDTTMKHHIPAVVFIDELSALGGGDNRFYARLLKRGRRRPGFPGISVFSISQEFAQKADVPRQTFSQMTHFVRFHVQHPYDQRESNKILRLPEHAQPAHQHGFWHARLDRPPLVATYYRGMEELDV